MCAFDCPRDLGSKRSGGPFRTTVLRKVKAISSDILIDIPHVDWNVRFPPNRKAFSFMLFRVDGNAKDLVKPFHVTEDSKLLK